VPTTPELDATATNRVAVLRHNLFVASETFIRAQAGALTRYAPFFVARRPLHDTPPGVEAYSSSDGASAIADLRYAVTARSGNLERVLRDHGAEIMHAHFGPDGLYASAAARRLALPLVVTLHGRDVTVRPSELLRSRKPVAIRYALERHKLGDRAARLICVSDEIRNAALRAGLPEDKLLTHYIGVDTVKYAVRPGEREPLIVHVARFVEKKGTTDLISAFSKISERHPHHRLALIGDGPLAPALRSQVRELGIESRVDFVGRIEPEEVRAMVGRAEVFVLPSVTASNGDREGLPIALIEAMSLGTTVLATRHSGIPEAIDSDDVGTLVEEHDVSAITGALDEMLSDPRATRELGLAGARRVRTHFDLAKQTRLLEGIYDDVR